MSNWLGTRVEKLRECKKDGVAPRDILGAISRDMQMQGFKSIARS